MVHTWNPSKDFFVFTHDDKLYICKKGKSTKERRKSRICKWSTGLIYRSKSVVDGFFFGDEMGIEERRDVKMHSIIMFNGVWDMDQTCLVVGIVLKGTIKKGNGSISILHVSFDCPLTLQYRQRPFQ